MSTPAQTATRTLTWGVVGPGAIGEVFAKSLAASGAGRVAAAHGRRPERNADYCARHGATAAGSLDELLDTDGLDALYVATPHPLHAEAVRAALARGIPVLCEKPMTTDPDETRSLVDLSRATGTLLLEAWMYRTHPQIARVLELVRGGELGAVRRIESRFCFAADPDPEHRLFSPALGGGAILDVGGYPASFAIAVAQAADPALVPTLAAVEGRRGTTGVDVDTTATLAFARPGQDTAFEGTVRCAIVDDSWCSAIVELERGTLSLEQPFLVEGHNHGLAGRLAITEGGETRLEEIRSEHDCYALEALEFARLLDTGETEPRAPMIGLDGSVAMAELLAAWREGVR